MKKILFVIDSLNSGGAERSLVTILNSLPIKYNIDLLLVKREGLYVDLVPDYVKVEEVKTLFPNVARFLLSMLLLINRILLALTIIKKVLHGAQTSWLINRFFYKGIDRHYDVAIAFSQGFPTYFVAEKIVARKKIAWVNTDYRKAGYCKKNDDRYYSKYDLINVVTQQAAEIFKAVYPAFNKKVIVIKDIISSDLIKKMSLESLPIALASESVKIVTVGRLETVKGYDLAIKAALILKERGVDFVWYVIGEGSLKEQLLQEIEELRLSNVFRLLGTFINPFPIIKACDIYCQTSLFEGYGMAIAEAKILNKPVVSTDFEVIYNQIENFKNGIIVEKSGEAIAEGLMYLIRDKKVWDTVKMNISLEKKGSDDQIKKVIAIIEDDEN